MGPPGHNLSWTPYGCRKEPSWVSGWPYPHQISDGGNNPRIAGPSKPPCDCTAHQGAAEVLKGGAHASLGAVFNDRVCDRPVSAKCNSKSEFNSREVGRLSRWASEFILAIVQIRTPQCIAVRGGHDEQTSCPLVHQDTYRSPTFLSGYSIELQMSGIETASARALYGADLRAVIMSLR
jgi:hypothetical protein